MQSDNWIPDGYSCPGEMCTIHLSQTQPVTLIEQLFFSILVTKSSLNYQSQLCPALCGTLQCQAADHLRSAFSTGSLFDTRGATHGSLFPEGPWELLPGEPGAGRAFLQACGGSSLMVEDTTSPFTLSWTIALSFRLLSPEGSERKESLISQGAMLRRGDAGKASFTVIHLLPPQLSYLYMFSFKSIFVIALCEMCCQKVTLGLVQVRADE